MTDISSTYMYFSMSGQGGQHTKKDIFFQIFSSDSDSLSHFTLTLNWI